ncbi:MAG: N-acetylglucosamine-6-phosphate deacetylase [Cyanobacteria bacterium P01_F01_bin.150]
MHIFNARLTGYKDLQHLSIGPDHCLEIIQAMSKAPSDLVAGTDGINGIDVQGDWVSPGGIDVQINGGLGLAFPEIERDHPDHGDRLDKIAAYLWEQGVDGFLPTIVTSSVHQVHQSLATFNELIPKINARPHRANILGIHLEGPFLNPTKRGAHPEEHLLPLTIAEVKRLLADYASIVSVITLAPELDPSGTVIPYLRSLGITVSLGHSLASATEATHAFKQGASMVTHAFNAMPSLHHRKPGLLGAALVHPTVTAGFIADGEHICITMLDLLLRANDNLFLVSDALAPLGLPDGLYPWDTRQIEVLNGTARLPDGTLSGTTLPLLDGVKNLVEWGLCDVARAIALATVAPRHAIGIDAWAIGQPFYPLRWTHNPETRSVSWQRMI